MPAKISFAADGRFIGSGTVFDAEPSFELLQVAFPEARSITWRLRPGAPVTVQWLKTAPAWSLERRSMGRFTVELGDKTATSWAD